MIDLPEITPLTPEEIETLDVAAAQRKLEENANHLIAVNRALMGAQRELGDARVRCEQLKALKSTVIEVNRALKAVVNSG